MFNLGEQVYPDDGVRTADHDARVLVHPPAQAAPQPIQVRGPSTGSIKGLGGKALDYSTG